MLCRSIKIPGEILCGRKLSRLKILINYLTPLPSLQFTGTTSSDIAHIYDIILVNLFVKHCPGNCNLKVWKRQKECYFQQKHHKFSYWNTNKVNTQYKKSNVLECIFISAISILPFLRQILIFFRLTGPLINL